jgi:hypothetical protein
VRKFPFALILMLSACAHPTIVKNVPVTVKVPVAQACAGSRPAPVIPLKDQMTEEQWKALDVKQKAAFVGKQGLDLRTYGEQLNAATGGCP